jgi:hypothetical protein
VHESRRARDEVEELSAPTGAVVYHAVKQEGEDELDRATSALAWSGLAAGMSMGFSFAAEGLLRAPLPDRPWRPLIAKFGYSVGFLIVVLGRQQLFTENTLTVILPALRRRGSCRTSFDCGRRCSWPTSSARRCSRSPSRTCRCSRRRSTTRCWRPRARPLRRRLAR